MKTCVVCHRPLQPQQKRYCSRECQRIGYALGISPQKEFYAKRIDEILKIKNRWGVAFQADDKRYQKNTIWKFRILIYAMIRVANYSETEVSKALGRDHSTIKHHLDHATWREKLVAEDFIKNKRYVFKKMPMYPPGFSYKD